MIQPFLIELEKISASSAERAKQKADSIRLELGKKLKARPYLAGSMAIGTNVKGKFDYDYGIATRSLTRYNKIISRLEEDPNITASPFNKPNTDYRVYATKMQGEPVDIAVALGEKGYDQRATIRHLSTVLTDHNKKTIADAKKLLSESRFLPKKRNKWFKRKADLLMGLPRWKREKITKTAGEGSQSEISRSDIFGHRTHNLADIIRSGRILSAAAARKTGKLKDYETGTAQLSRERSSKIPEKLRSEVFATRGLLPAEGYGPYGVMFRSRKAAPSQYLNTIPEEHVIADQVASKMTFVVPDQERQRWEKQFPQARFVSESDVPDKKRLESSSFGELPKRLLRGPKFTQETEDVA